jgi:hypothetical protein
MREMFPKPLLLFVEFCGAVQHYSMFICTLASAVSISICLAGVEKPMPFMVVARLLQNSVHAKIFRFGAYVE